MVQLRWWIAALIAASGCGDHADKQPALGDAAVASDDASVDAPPDASPGSNVPDDGFGTHGSVTFATGMTCVGFALDASDRALVVTNTPTTTTLSRYSDTGALDPSFGTGGSVALPTGIGAVTAFALASGKTVVVGTDLLDTMHYAVHLYRFTSGGTLELDLVLPATVESFSVVARDRADGDLELVTFGAAAGQAFALVRITAAGVLDAAFGDNGVRVLDTSAYGMNPGYFPHGTALADGTFVLTGASFGPVGQGVGPINGHLIRVEDGAITAHVEFDNTQFFSLVADGAKPVVFQSSFPDDHGTIAAIDPITLQPDPASALAFPVAIDGRYGSFSGAALSFGHGMEMIVAQPANTSMTLARYQDDAGHESHGSGLVAASAIGYCGAALDSKARPVFASATGLYRFAP